MNYADPFAVQQTTPLSRALRTIELQATVQLNWPSGYLGPNYLASINQVNASAAGFALIMPSAKGANEGTGLFFINIGTPSADIKNFDGTLLTTLPAGTAKYMYCADNTTDAGVWRITTFGGTTSGADASLLAGPGLTAINGLLSAAHQVSTSASDVTVAVGDRAKVFAANAGSMNLNLPSYTAAGNNFFIGAHNAGSGTMTITPPAGTIDGYTSLALAPNESVFVFCSGTSAWYTIGYGRSTQFQFTKLVKDVTAGGTITLSSAEASNKLLQFIGIPASNVDLIVPSVVGIYYVQNSYSGSNSLTVKTVAGSGVALSASDRAILYCDGTNVVAAQSVAVGTNLSIVDGSLASPAINFAADVNTGLFRADIDTLGIASNGQEAARFNVASSAVSGFFGVGIAAPVVQMHVKSGTAEALRIQGTGAYQTFYDTPGTTRYGYIAGNPLELRDFVDGAGTRTFYINGTKRLTIDSTGITVNGTITSSSAPYATLIGGNVFTGIQVMEVQRMKVIPLGNVTGAKNIDMALGGTYTATITGVSNFTFSNSPPAGTDQTVYLKITNGGNFATTFPAGTLYPNGATVPVLTAGGKDLLAVWYDVEQAKYVVGMVWKDYR